MTPSEQLERHRRSLVRVDGGLSAAGPPASAKDSRRAPSPRVARTRSHPGLIDRSTLQRTRAHRRRRTVVDGAPASIGSAIHHNEERDQEKRCDQRHERRALEKCLCSSYPLSAAVGKSEEAREVAIRRRDQGHELLEQLEPGHDELATAIGQGASCRMRSDHRTVRSSVTTPLHLGCCTRTAATSLDGRWPSPAWRHATRSPR